MGIVFQFIVFGWTEKPCFDIVNLQFGLSFDIS